MHIVEAIIAKEETTKEIEESFVFAKSIPLSQGFAMVPLTDQLKDDLDELVGKETTPYECFEKLTDSVCDIILQTKQPYKIAYIETEYFGGEGVQSAVVWENGSVVYGPNSSKYTQNPINEALKKIGVRVIKQLDEFDEINLGWNRDTDKWFNSNS